MKHFTIYFGLAMALVSSCSIQEDDHTTPQRDDVVYYASFEQPAEEGTRVYANEDLLLRWTADDRVSIFGKNTYNQQYKFLGETGDNSGGFSKVDGAEYVTGNPISHTFSVYPYQASTRITEDEVLSVTLPAEQHYAENSFGLGASTMVSVSSDNVLQYKSVGGFLRISLYGEGVTVSSITLKGNNGEKLAGKATITMPVDGRPSVSMADDATDAITLVCDSPVTLGATAEGSVNFWLVVPPIVFSKGFQIMVACNGGVFEKATEKTVTIERNNLSKMSPIEVTLSQPKNVIYYTSFDGRPILPTSINGFGANFVSHEYVNGQGKYIFDGDVTSIGMDAFSGCTSLTSIEMPNSVTSIGANAFSGCNRLASVLIPDSVASIEQYAFLSCNSLQSILLPESLSSIDITAFMMCNALTTMIVAPDNPTYDSRNECNAVIETETNSLIIGCHGTTIPDSVTSIGEDVFSSFKDLSSIVIPNSVKSIGDRAFIFSGLTSINIPDSVTHIGERAFSGCSNVAEIIVDSGNPVFDSRNDCNAIIETQSNTLVLGCQNSRIPDSVTQIGSFAFEYCTSLTSIKIPDSVRTIGYMSFRGCTGLTAIEIPPFVSYIIQSAFSGCKGLTSITVLATNPPYFDKYYGDADYNVFYGTNDCPIYVPAESVETYKSTKGWSEYADRIQPSIIEVSSITLDKTSISLKEGETTTLVATVTPDNATDKTIVWKSSDEGVAIVDANGQVSGIHKGNAIVSASAGGKSAQCSVSVTSADSGNNEYLSFVSLDPTCYISYKTNGLGVRIEYSYDTQNWETWKSGLSVALNPGTKLYVRGGNWKTTTTFSFKMTGRVAASGNFMSLLYADDFPDRKGFDKNYQLSSVFKGNTNLVEAPNLPATSLTSECYKEFYSGCTNLVKVPDLPATEMAERCYEKMFAGCTSLITAPNLSAEKLAYSCCRSMFYGCTNLSQAPSLPATDLTGGNLCYCEMFGNCTSLKMPPILPATTLASWCYSYMFGGCTGLERAPDLPATELEEYCYYSMFDRCVNLVHAPSLPATVLAESCYSRMFNQCERLIVPPSLPALPLAKNCYAGMFSLCSSLTNAPELPSTTLSEGCYSRMFEGCYSLTKAPDLPATSLADGCYHGMFDACTNLIQAPALPAVSLASSCYSEMFMNCTGLTNAPELPATMLSTGCYSGMFSGCDGLTEAPVLPATSLADGCYSNMFKGSKNLVQAPALPATTLASGCYSGMFSGCSSITDAPELPATTLFERCYACMFEMTKLSKAPKLPATVLAANCYTGMFNYCQYLTQAPELPAITLVTDCYARMFYRCEKVGYIKMMAINIPNKSFLSQWLDGTEKQGMFIKNAAATWVETDIIPSGWTVATASE